MGDVGDLCDPIKVVAQCGRVCRRGVDRGELWHIGGWDVVSQMSTEVPGRPEMIMVGIDLAFNGVINHDV
jgi:hypothetical protein